MLSLSKNDILFHAATHETVAAVVSTSLLKTSKPQRQNSVYSNTAAVNISGCITSLLIIGESELLTKLA